MSFGIMTKGGGTWIGLPKSISSYSFSWWRRCWSCLLIRETQLFKVWLIFSALVIFFLYLIFITRKLINTNRNIERIFLSVKFLRNLPMKIFSQYIPRELQWGKNLNKAKKNDVSFLSMKLLPEFILSVNSLVNCEHCSSCQLQRESPMEFSVGIFQRAPELFTFQLHC